MKWSRPSRWAITLAATTCLIGTLPRAEAGSGTYDPVKKSFSLNYIYLDLPGVIDQGQVNLSVRRTSPTTEQAQTVNLFLARVSNRLSDFTSGRAKIGQLTEVQDVKKADVVISLTGSVKPAGAGGAWAGQHGFQQGGTANLYYLDLVNDKAGDVVDTVVHELCHYFFGLPDEYPGGTIRDRLCPLVAPGQDRCLMDNFHYGALGRFCQDSDHNAAAPGRNGFTPVEPVAESCRAIVDAFFDNLKVKADSGAVASTTDSSTSSKVAQITPDQKDSVLKRAREALGKLKAQRTGGKLTGADRKNILGHIVAGLVDTFKDKLSTINIPQVAQDLVSSLILTPLGVPPGLQVIEKILLAKAFDLAKSALNRNGNGNADDVEQKLLTFAQGELKKATGGAPFGEDEAAYIRDLAQKTVAGELPNQPETIEQIRDELSIEIIRTMNAIANQLNLPGPVDRGENALRIVSALQQQSKIPDRALGTRFGRRRTVLIEPPILVETPIFTRKAPKPGLSPGIDYVLTQGDISNYNNIRKDNTELFSKLIDRSRVNVVSAVSVADRGEEQKLMDDVKVGVVDLKSSNFDDIFQIDKKAGTDLVKVDKDSAEIDQGLTTDVLELRKTRTLDLLAVVKDQIERDQIENIVVVVPPGGLPDEFAEPIGSLGEQFIGKADLRIDIALVGSAKIPAELRDLVVRSKGSILTVTDADEIGAIAQRLAGEQTQGTWITIPQQDMLVLAADHKPDEFDRSKALPIYARLRGMRTGHAIDLKASDAPKVVLRPFYVDDSNDYELIVGLTQPLTIAGLSPILNADKSKPSVLISRTAANLGLCPEPQMRLMPGQIRDPAQVASMEKEPSGRMTFAQTRQIIFDRSKSTPTALVFRLPGSKTGSGTGWFTPVLNLGVGNFKDVTIKDDKGVKEMVPQDHAYGEQVIHFTFSVSTASSKAQLVANLIQQGPNGGQALQQGTIGSGEVEAIVTASLTAGAAVVDAEVLGFVQKIDESSEDITTGQISFKDDGKAPDKTPGDGIYTASIPLETRRPKSAEYRVFIDGHSVEGKSKFIPAGESIPKPDEATNEAGSSATKLLDRPAPVFQRATSVHFYVPSNSTR